MQQCHATTVGLPETSQAAFRVKAEFVVQRDEIRVFPHQGVTCEAWGMFVTWWTVELPNAQSIRKRTSPDADRGAPGRVGTVMGRAGGGLAGCDGRGPG